MTTLTTTDRLSISLKLREISELQGLLFESLIDAADPVALLAGINELHDRAADALAQVVGLCRKPGEYAFVGANIELPDERTAEQDKASQYFVETRRAG